MEPHTYLLDLATRLVALDEGAYLEFAELFGPRFYRFFVSHGLEHFEAEDLAATCVTDIALKVHRFRAEAGTFSSWVFAIARNTLADLYEKRKRHADALRNVEPPDADELFWDTEIALEVIAALEELSESDRTLVQRRLSGADHSFRELAAELGLSENNARVRHLRAIRHLEERLMQMPAVQARINRGRGSKRTA